MKRLELLLPGLPMGDPHGLSHLAPTLVRLLALADRQVASAGDVDAWLGQRFGLACKSQLPVAALSHLADRGEAQGWWIRADPVHLHADMHQLLLSDWTADDLCMDEVEALLESLNAHYDDLTWHFEAAHPQRWYLHTSEAADIHTVPLPGALGKDVRELLPGGSAARQWRAQLTEIQMLLFEHPVNQAREARGAMTVNSLWFWGEGELPDSATPPVGRVFGDSALLQGLARLSGCELHALPESASRWREVGVADSLVVLPALQGRADLVACLETLERDWFAPLLRDLRLARLSTLHLLPGDGYDYRLTPRHAWRLWRGRKGAPS